MASQAMIDEASGIIKDMVAARKAFTAYNVTKELRNKLGRSQPVPHGEMRQVVHGIFRQNQMDDYQQVQVQPSGFPSPAILYYPPETDPNDFTGAILEPKAPSAPAPDVDGDDDDEEDDDDASGDVVVRTLTADGILYIPRWMGRKMGVQAGNVHVEGDSSGLLVISNGTPASCKYHPHVDTRKNIRLGKSLLVSLGADWSSYKIEFKTDHVTISKG